MTNVEKTGVNTFYAVDLDDREFVVEEMYDVNADYCDYEIVACDGGEEPTEEQKDKIMEALSNYQGGVK